MARRRRVLRGFADGSTGSKLGSRDWCESSSLSDRRRHALFARRAVRIEPSRVKVPRANTEAVTMGKSASAIMFDLRRLITYSWKYMSFRYSWYIQTANERIVAAWARMMILT